ncbi:MAG: MBL fold metallo-hydrolase [Euzebya sp.]
MSQGSTGMRVSTISTEGLGDRTYVVSHGNMAVVIDPQRDIDRVLDHLAEHDLDVALVCETHIHNDYVTGGLALSRITGADYVISAKDGVTFDRRAVDPDEVIDLDGLSVTVIASPGHTPNHLSYLVQSGTAALFTGGSMLYGTVGRTDLIGSEHTEGLTRAQYRSVRHMAKTLPADTEVYPTHGFGSFCASAGGGDRTSGTIADERTENLACTSQDEDSFVRTLMNGFAAYPPYYAHMGPLNLAGPQAPDLGTLSAAEPEQLAKRMAMGEWVVDLRPRRDFAQRHLAGSVNVDVDGAVATYLGWAIPWGTPISLVADTREQIATAQRELVRIGIDRPLSMATGGVEAFAKGQQTEGYRAVTFADLAENAEVTVVDVRRQDEWDEGHIEGAIHLPMERVATGAAELPSDRDLWVHCASGYRASIASSLIARAGKRVVYVDDDWDNVADSGRQHQQTQREEQR